MDRGLSQFAVAATAAGQETPLRNDVLPWALARGLARQRRLARAVTRKQRGSRNRAKAAARLGRHHARVAATRRHFLHQVSNELAKNHGRLVLEDLHVAGMIRNRHLARAISDAGWGQFARMLGYKQAWSGGQILAASRWYPSSNGAPPAAPSRTPCRCRNGLAAGPREGWCGTSCPDTLYC